MKNNSYSSIYEKLGVTPVINAFGVDTTVGGWTLSPKVAKAMDKVIKCERIGVAVIGLEVSHAHIHLVPINGVSDINFERPKLKFSEEEMKSVVDLIKSAI